MAALSIALPAGPGTVTTIMIYGRKLCILHNLLRQPVIGIMIGGYES